MKLLIIAGNKIERMPKFKPKMQDKETTIAVSYHVCVCVLCDIIYLIFAAAIK